ncbi:hypothetical protein [Paenibacillus sp. KN14-4R]|uniref:hypothetical protein n=1 Tax=Paenibacillus sp. KN14-4R TaxID=3445773 RepID=UPI003F9F4362
MPKTAFVPIYVSDLSYALQFCCNILGFEISHEIDGHTVCLIHEYMTITLCQTDQIAQLRYPQAAQMKLSQYSEDLTITMETWNKIGQDMNHN